MRTRRGGLEELTREVELALAEHLDHARQVAAVVRELAASSTRQREVTVAMTQHHDATAVRFHDPSDRAHELDERRHLVLSRNAIRWSTIGGEHGRTISFEMIRPPVQASDEPVATSIRDRPARLAR